MTNKIFLVFLFCGAMAVNCTKSSYITIDTDSAGELEEIALAGTGSAIIDWGDGSIPEEVTLRSLPTNTEERLNMDIGYLFPHTYTKEGIKRITVTGNISGIRTGINLSIIDLDVQRMPSLEHISCYDTELMTLNVTKNIALKELICLDNKLSGIDISKNTALETLFCDGNELKVLDCSNNPALMVIQCASNQLEMLDVRKNSALSGLYCDNNKLSTLDVSNNVVLKILSCSNNQLQSLDMSNNTEIIYLNCRVNNLQYPALVALFASLPRRTAEDYARISCGGNPGYDAITEADKEMLAKKNWEIID
jgi:hypothetical protein